MAPKNIYTIPESKFAAYHEGIRKAALARNPIPELTDKLDPKKTKGPPELHFGLALTERQLLKYAKSHHLVNSSYPDDPLDIYSCQLPALLRLREITEVDTMYIADPFLGPDGGYIMVALYSNYTMRRYKYIDEHEKEILDIVRKELKIEGQRAIWYWDCGNDW
ncbi:hypothetical protein BV25DRAFT_1829970 [Artomyces pyxidatus]|uniref:Uncharacterized protein n=1 Tax=Artomyces pyxidatus TaxID=48021 RepID=A0ACB8SQ87_9AGAM|nr:hypothetical protein BV25DRAFT_1829970 [Artomyces pyxidatus]